MEAGITKIPFLFNCKQFDFTEYPKADNSKFTFPLVDLQGVEMTDSATRAEIVAKVQDAYERWDFFQIINHGIPTNLLDEMIDGIRRFHDLDTDVRKRFYTRDRSKKVLYFSNFDLFEAPVTNWRDTVAFPTDPNQPECEELPTVCRDVVVEYSKQVKQLGLTIFELTSEALGLKASYIRDVCGCTERQLIAGHCYPPCPEPELTMGATLHSDNSFLTILLQDHIGGLQVLHQNYLVDVTPLPGALIVNTGDLLRLVSNDRFKSINHRVVAKREDPRISVATFFRSHDIDGSKRRWHGPIPELISKENPPVYGNVNLKEYIDHYFKKGLDGTSALIPFKLQMQ